MNDTNKRDAYFDNVRFFLMLCVVLCHGLEHFRSMSIFVKSLHNIILLFVMPLFVFVSGFFAKSMAIEDSPKRKRIINLIILYLVSQIIKCMILNKYTLIKPQYANWYLLCIIAWYTILPLLNEIKPLNIALISIVFGLLIGIEKEGMNILQVSRMFCFFPFFIIGYSLKKEHIELIREKKIIGLVGTVFCSFAILFLMDKGLPLSVLHANKCYSEMKLSIMLGITYRMLWYLLSSIMGISVLSVIPKNKTFFTVYGTRTLPIYIIHTCIYCYLINRTPLIDFVIDNLKSSSLIIFNFFVSIFIVMFCGNSFFSKIFDFVMQYDFTKSEERTTQK